jgi:hypothetical protein
VVLNACQGAAADSADALLGVAQQIAGKGVPAVVAMQWDIYDWAAQKLAATFYQALCSGPEAGEVETALTRARAALFDDAPDSRAFATPVLLLRAEGERLWEAKKKGDAAHEGGAVVDLTGGGIHLGGQAHVTGDVFTGGKRTINTGGGSYFEGPIEVGGDFVGGNKTVTQTAGGDIVGRDKVTTTTHGPDALQAQALAEQFRQIQRQVEALPPNPDVDPEEVKGLVQRIEAEAQKGERANPAPLERWLDNLGDVAESIFAATTEALSRPGFGLGKAVQIAVARARAARGRNTGPGQ